jgi:hypothetical protein
MRAGVGVRVCSCVCLCVAVVCAWVVHMCMYAITLVGLGDLACAAEPERLPFQADEARDLE